MQPTITKDLFISHAARDSEWVHGYLLPALGLPPEQIITSQDFRLGEPLIDEFEHAVLESRYTLVILSEAYLADQWLRFGGQVARFLSIEEQQNRLIPLRLGRFDLPPHLKALVALDYTVEANWERETTRLRNRLKSPAPSDEFIACPYPGMVPFREADADRFYGREAEIGQMIDRLQQHRLLFVIGPSGSGKSSLVFAGLLPRLAAGRHFAPDFWRIYSMRPGAQPTKTLVELLAGDLSQQADLVAAALARPPTAQRLLLVIDQFEELFSQAERGEQMRFIAALLALRAFENCVLLITMRADFYPELMNSTMWSVVQSQRLEVAPLRGATLREAIQRPAADAGVYLEPALVERLIADGDDAPGVLPLLQETMRLLWTKRQRRLLTLSAYEQMGQDGCSGLAIAVATKADATLAELSPVQQQIARRVFLCLVRLGENSPDTRRQQPLCELRSPKDDSADFKFTMEHLTVNRLVIRDSSGQVKAGDPEAHVLVDLAHEVLITSWPLLKTWLVEDRAGLLFHQRLGQTCDDWIKHKRDGSFLYSGSRLVDAERYAEQHPNDMSEDETEFLAASAARELVRQRARYLGQAAGGALGAAFGYGLALALGDWSRPDNFLPQRLRLLSALITFLLTFPLGEAIGFSVGLALWRWRDDPRRRLIAATLIGALIGTLLYGFHSLVRSGEGFGIPFERVLAGLILGATIGLSVSFPATGWRRVGLVALSSAAAALLVSSLGLVDWQIWIAPIAGAILGGLTGLGFVLAAVDNREDLIE